jgi:hypothetical protein
LHGDCMLIARQTFGEETQVGGLTL